MARFRISYNAPVVLTFAILAVIVQLLPGDTQTKWFASHGTLDNGLPDYIGLFSHILGHANWDHLLANFMFILLIGPILEERFKSATLLGMILVTALLSGLVDVIIGSGTHGASGIVFMMIILASTANIRQGEIPLTFIAIFLIFVGREVYNAVNNPDDNISQLGHILGGISGAAFGFIGARARHLDTSIKPTAAKAMLPTTTKPAAVKKPL